MKKGRFLILSLVITLVTSIFSVMSVAAAPLYGDLNSDGSIDAIDYSLMKGYLFGVSNISDPLAADLNGDGKIDALDYALLKQYMLNIITKFPVESIPVVETPQQKLMGDIIFSVPSSTFRTQVSVTLGSTNATAQIRYTTDGSIPTSSSSLYTNALTFTKTTQLRAQAFVNGSLNGAMGTAVYVASSLDAKHDLPVLILDAYGKGKPARDYKDVAVMLMEPKNNEASLLQTPTFATRGGFHVRGQSSANFEKTPYRLELWDNENNDAKYPIMGMPADGDWALLSPLPGQILDP